MKQFISSLLAAMFQLASVAGTNETGAAEMNFNVLQFNIWNEAHHVENGIDNIVKAIIVSKADIVAFSEVRNKKGDWHKIILRELEQRGELYHGKYGGGDVGLISRFPIAKTEVVFDKTDINRGSLVAYHLELPNQQKIIVCSAHLDWKYYALNLPRGYNGGIPNFKLIDTDKNGKPDYVLDVKTIISYNQKSFKDEAIKDFCSYADSAQYMSTPVILAGDFNDGSHLDWTAPTKDLYGHAGLIIPWENTITLDQHNFIDAYRELHPEPVTHPGITWPSPVYKKESTSWTPLSDERDRIDYIFYRSSLLQAKDALIVGPKMSYKYNKLIGDKGKDTFICDDINWPSDHKGVLVEFTLKQQD